MKDQCDRKQNSLYKDKRWWELGECVDKGVQIMALPSAG